MALLVGRYVNKIDKKGRISVPKPFRDTFRDQDFAGLYAYPLFKFPAIEACGEDFMVRVSGSLEDGFRISPGAEGGVHVDGTVAGGQNLQHLAQHHRRVGGRRHG